MAGCSFNVLAKPITLLVFLLYCQLYLVGGDGLCWTNWINRYASTEGNDQEILDYNAMNTYNVCLRPYAVDFVRVDGAPSNPKIKCYFNGCKCRGADQAPGDECGDYKIRFLCPCSRVPNKHEIDSSYLKCNGETSLDLKCPPGSKIRVKTVHHGIVWFSRCGISPLGSHCPNSNDASLFAAVSNLCNGRSNCSIDLTKMLANKIPSDNCNLVYPKQFHAEIQCRRGCFYADKVIRSGSVFPANNCNEKCHCLHNGQIVCHPLCPRLQFSNCSRDAVVRLALVAAPDFPECRCYEALCDLPVKTGCFFNGKRRAPDQSFHVDCKYNCRCLSSGKVKCQRLCSPLKKAQCMAGTVRETIAMATAYPMCQCERSVCRTNS